MSEGDRWTRIEAVFADLSDASRERREQVLASLDDEIAREVLRLLRAHDAVSGGHGFLERLDAGRAHALVDTGTASPPGMHIGRYPVVRQLGRGGMGIVYLARDVRLDRPVAIKLLPHYLSGDPTAVQRLATEARTASALDHPNIATVYEIDETPDGQAFIVMAYYDGETLRERLAHGPVYRDEALDVGIQLAEGLAAAHRAGIIHRDVKPENVVVTRNGIVKILDFGIAKAASADLATGGMMRGTAAYMSPEQSRGEVVDGRTDIWSLGVVLHELLTGTRPFAGEGEALINAIRSDPPAPLAPTRSGVPPALTTLIGRCLAKDRAERPATASDLAESLRAIRDGAPPRAARHERRWIAASMLGAAALALAVILTGRRSSSPPPASAAAAATPAVAVLPFDVRGPNLEVWREGMVDLLATNIDGVEGLRAIDGRTLLARWARDTRGGTADFDQAIGVARATGARYAVLGSVTGSGTNLRITAAVHSVAERARIGSFQVDGPADSMLALVDQLTIELLAALSQGSEQPDRNIQLARITTASLPALKAYLNGEQLLRRGQSLRAIDAYDQAIAADSTFAFAYYHLALAASWIGEPMAPARQWVEALKLALRHAHRLPERERTLLRVAHAVQTPTALDLVETLRLAQRATERYPDDAEAWYLLGEVYHHAGESLLVPWSEGERAFRMAIQLDPGFTVPYVHLVNHVFNDSPDSARVARVIEAFRAIAPESPFLQDCDLAMALAFGDSAQRAAAIRTLRRLPAAQFNAATWTLLIHPRYGDALLEALQSRPVVSDSRGRAQLAALLRVALERGDIRAAERHLVNPLLWDGTRATTIYRLRRAGLTLPDSLLDSLRVVPPSPTALDTSVATGRILLAGAFAAEERRWRDYATAAARLRTREAAWLSIGDSANARYARGTGAALAGFAALQRGDTSGGLALLMRGQVQTTWMGSTNRQAMNAEIRWWIAEALERSGRNDDAMRYYKSFMWDPFVAERAAPFYERMGRAEDAREAFARVAYAWRDGDPIFRERAAAARAAANRLSEQR